MAGRRVKVEIIVTFRDGGWSFLQLPQAVVFHRKGWEERGLGLDSHRRVWVTRVVFE